MTHPLVIGEPAPWFRAPVRGGGAEGFDTVAGQWVLLLLLSKASTRCAGQALATLAAHRASFMTGARFRGVVAPTGAGWPGDLPAVPEGRWFLDRDGAIAAAYGVAGRAGEWLLLDPMLRVADRADLADGAQLFRRLADRTAAPAHDQAAPVLAVPGVLPPDLCRDLIAAFDRHGGEESGFMREERGLTVERADHRHKRRSDHHLADPALLAAVKQRVSLVLRPMIRRAFQFDATRIERYLVACYDGAHGGHFRGHRDNTTRGTAHRRFACTINLNAEDFTGGELCFPEFGPRGYRGATGEAIVFSCSLLHEARPVTAGRRYAFLPFLYDEAGAVLRERNQAFLAPERQGYRADAA